MKRLSAALCMLVVLLGATGCQLQGQSDAKEEAPQPPAPAPTVIAEEFGPLVYRIAPELRPEWEQVLQLHERMFLKQGKTVEEDDLHRLYNQADTNDDDVLERAEIGEAFRQMKREYERILVRGS